MGAGKPNSSFRPLMIKVLRNTSQKELMANSFSKFSKPIHGLPQMPIRNMYFLKAICTPKMGRYLNKM